MKKEPSLYTKEFVLFNVVFFLSFLNMAVFFQFHQYLAILPIDQDLTGILIGAFALAGLIFQPILSPFVRADNARPILAAGIFATMCSLLAYRFADTFLPLLALRFVHGLGFIAFVTAMNACVVSLIPPQRAGQAFGLISINFLLPMAVVPALLGILKVGPGDFVIMLTIAAFLMLPGAALLPLTRRTAAAPAQAAARPSLRDIAAVLRDVRVGILLATQLLSFLAYACVFFFLKDYAEGKGVANPGEFFSVVTLTMIAIRILGGRFFDVFNKGRMLLLSLAILCVAYTLLTVVTPGLVFYVLAFIFGIAWGFFMPVMNGLLFDLSPPAFRGLSLNLSMLALQAGYFLGPIFGGLILARGGYSPLFLYCGALLFTGTCLNLVFLKKEKSSL